VWQEWKQEAEAAGAVISRQLSARTLQRIERGVQKHGLASAAQTGEQLKAIEVVHG